MQGGCCIWPWMFYISHQCWLLQPDRLCSFRTSTSELSVLDIQFQRSAWHTFFFLFFFTAVHFTSSKHSAPVHQMQYYIPTPQSPNRTLSCQIDSLVNSTSWIWYCLATAEKLLLAASFGMRSGLERSCGKGRRRLGEKKWGYINYNGSVWFRLPSGSPPGTRQN